MLSSHFFIQEAGTSSKAASHRRRQRRTRASEHDAGASTDEDEEDGVDAEQPEKRPLKAAKQTFEGAADPMLLLRSSVDDAKGTLLHQAAARVQPRIAVPGVFVVQPVPPVKTLKLVPSSFSQRTSEVARSAGNSASISGTPTPSASWRQLKPKIGTPSSGSGTPTASLQTRLPSSPWPQLASPNSSPSLSLRGPGSPWQALNTPTGSRRSLVLPGHAVTLQVG